MLPDIAGYNPHVTTPVTDMVYAAQQDDPQMPALLQEAWQPEQPFTFQRSQQRGSAADKLLVSPVQFRPSDTEAGALRRFGQMVFEVSYVDPRRASLALQTDTVPPLIGNVVIAPVIQQAATGAAPAADQTLRITARVRDTGGSGISSVTALYTSMAGAGRQPCSPRPALAQASTRPPSRRRRSAGASSRSSTRATRLAMRPHIPAKASCQGSSAPSSCRWPDGSH